MCMRTRVALTVGASLSALLAGNAFGDTVTGQYDQPIKKDIGIRAVGWAHGNPIFGWAATTTVGEYRWTRSDLPAGPGVDNTIPENFVSYCIDLNEFVHGQQTHTFQVVELNTAFDATQILLLSRLWGGFQSLAVDVDTQAAFQVAIYEIQRDGTNLNLSGGDFILQNTSSNEDIMEKASEWLAQVGNLNINLPTPELVILANPTQQDQITLRGIIPAPGTGALALAGAGLLAGRRRRTA